MAQKVLLIILGVILFIGGLYCMMTPGLTYLIIAPVAGVGMLFDAISFFVLWNSMRKAGENNFLMLVGAIISLLLGIALLGSIGMQLAYDLMIAYMVAAWLVISGILRIVSAFKMEKKVLMIVVGVLITLCGIMGFANPVSIMLALGMIIGLSIVVSGVGVLSFAFML